MSLLEFWRRASRDKLFMIGLVLVLAVTICAVFAGLLSPYDPYEQHLTDRLLSPNKTYLMGTDWAGRDSLSRLLYGSRITLNIAFSSVALGVLLGVLMGLCGGFFGGAVDTVLNAIINVIFAFPSLVLALAISVLLGPSTSNLILVLGILYAPIVARIARGSTLSVKEEDYILAAEALGCPTDRILFRHLLPNLIGPILVQITIGFSWCILSESSLTYLGFGAQPPDASWGSMLNEGRPTIWVSAWPSVFAGAFISVAVLGFNFLGDGLRDIMDPTLRHR